MSAITAVDQIDPAELQRLLAVMDKIQAANPDAPDPFETRELELDLSAFIKQAWPVIEPGTPFKHNWHIDLICEYLTAVSRGEIKRLLINLPPRHGKSNLVTVMWPVWRWTTNPTLRFIFSSYSSGLSIKHSLDRRAIIQSDWYEQRWGHRVQLSADANLKSEFTNTKRGAMVATSTGGTVTGKGGDCLAGETRILTERGWVPIAELHRTGFRGLVLGYDHVSNQPVWRRVIASREVVGRDLVEIRSVHGRRFACTADHLVFVGESGYRAACHLDPGHRRTPEGLQGVQELLCVRTAEERYRGALSGVLQPDSGNRVTSGNAHLSVLPKGIRATGVRRTKNDQARTPRHVLFVRLLEKASRRQERKPLSRMRKAEARKAPSHVLLRRVQVCGNRAAHCREPQTHRMPHLWHRVSSYCREASTVLLTRMREYGAFVSDAWHWQFPLQERNQLCQVVPGNAPVHHGAGRPQVRGVRADRGAVYACLAGYDDYPDQSHDSPHRRGSGQQHAGKLGDALQDVSCNPPQVERDTVELVRSVRGGSVPVYDLQVEGCHNFFAEGVLVHNCIIVDDPQNPEEAYSSNEREAAIRFFDQTLSTRLDQPEEGAIVVIMQRLHQSDVSGHLLERDDYVHLKLPTEAEEREVIHFPISGREVIRERGDLLWPKRVGPDAVASLRRSLGPWGYAAQCQQRPVPQGGGIFANEWWKFYPREMAPFIKPHARRIVMFLDTAQQKGKLNDYSVAAIWAEVTHKITDEYQAGYYLLDLWRDRVDFPDLIDKVVELRSRYALSRIVIENKASGISLSQMLQKQRIPVELFNPDKDKEARAHATSGFVRDGLCYLPSEARWLPEFLEEHSNFPKVEHDDIVDTTSQMLSYYELNKTSGTPLVKFRRNKTKLRTAR